MNFSAKAYTAATDDIAGAYIAGSGQATYASDDEFVITLSSVTATDVAGTFSGKVDNGSGIKTITEGTFAAKFQ